MRDLFGLIVCLVIDEDTLRHRLATRTNNTFGHHPEEPATALMWSPRMQAIYEGRGATIIKASHPVAEVVDHIIDAAQGPDSLDPIDQIASARRADAVVLRLIPLRRPIHLMPSAPSAVIRFITSTCLPPLAVAVLQENACTARFAARAHPH